MHGGGSGNDAALSKGSCLLPKLSSELSLPRRLSWKLELLRHLGDGDSSLVSPSWKVEARLRLGNRHGGDSSPRGHSSLVAASSDEHDL